MQCFSNNYKTQSSVKLAHLIRFFFDEFLKDHFDSYHYFLFALKVP